MHPFQPWLLTVSGSRSYLSIPADGQSDSSSDDSSEESVDSASDEPTPHRLLSGRSLSAADASMRLWSLASSQDL